MIWHDKCYWVMVMRFALALVVLAISFGMARDAAGQTTAQKQSKSAKAVTAMTGCVDEQDGHYVLISDRDRSVIANLEAEGFPTEGFAKYVGQKVTVRGTSIPSGERPLFRVRTIDTVSETCEPPALN